MSENAMNGLPPGVSPTDVLRIEDLRKAKGHFVLANTGTPARFYTANVSPTGERELRATFDDPDVSRFPSKIEARECGKAWGLRTWRYAKIVGGEICNWWPEVRCWIPQRLPYTYVQGRGTVWIFGTSSFEECVKDPDEN